MCLKRFGANLVRFQQMYSLRPGDSALSSRRGHDVITLRAYIIIAIMYRILLLLFLNRYIHTYIQICVLH